MESWLVPASPVIFTEEIKKSRFITLLDHTEGVEAAKAFVAQARADYPDARHYCQAWVAARPMIRSNSGSRTTVNRRARPENRCWRS